MLDVKYKIQNKTKNYMNWMLWKLRVISGLWKTCKLALSKQGIWNLLTVLIFSSYGPRENDMVIYVLMLSRENL